MTRSVSIHVGLAAVLVLSLLAASATPIQATDAEELVAATDGLVVGSQHDTGDEFAGGDLRSLSINGSASSPSATAEYRTRTGIVDGFEDGDISEYSGDTGAWQVQSTTVHSGSNALKITSLPNSSPEITGSDFLPRNPRPGDTFESYIRFTDNYPVGILQFAKTGQGTGYYVYVDNNDNSVSLGDRDGFQHFDTASASIPTSEWLRIVVDWGTNGNITATLYDSQGTELASLSATSTKYGHGSIGFESTGDTVFDDGEILSSSSSSVEYYSASHYVGSADQARLNVTQYANIDADMAVQYYDGSSWVTENTTSLSGTGTYTLDVDNDAVDRWRIRVLGTPTSGTTEFSIDAESILFTPHAPTAVSFSPSDGANLTNRETTFSVSVSDADFPTVQGDQVEAALFVDGSQVASESVTSNQTVAIDYVVDEGGSHTYHWELTDSYGSGQDTVTSTRTINVPASLTVRNETGNHSILSNLTTTAEVTFYANNTIVTRSVNNGTVSLEGLEVSDEFVVTINADGWYSRRILIDSLYSQSTIYLLNTSEPAVYNEFALNDLTGNYPRETTRLYVKRGMTVSNTSAYYTIAGDYLGATGTFPVELLEGARYKIVLETKSGRRTSVGAYLAESEGVKTIRVGTVEFEYPDDDSWHAIARQNGSMLYWKFSDPQQKTKDLQLQIHQRGNDSVIIYEDSVNELGNYTLSVNLEGVDVVNATQKDWVIEWSATRAGSEISGTTPFTPMQDYPIPLGQVWKAGLSFVMVAFVAALGGGRYSPEGAIATVAIAGILMGTGFADLYGFAWWVALVIAIGGYVYERGVPL